VVSDLQQRIFVYKDCPYAIELRNSWPAQCREVDHLFGPHAGKGRSGELSLLYVDPNFGIVPLPDKRLDRLCEIFKPKRRVPAVVEFVDIAGLVQGASKGEGLGNQFLSHIREVGMIAHVVRCFDDPDVIHVAGRVDPADDIEVIHTELALADLDSLDRRLDKLGRQLKCRTRISKRTQKKRSPC